MYTKLTKKFITENILPHLNISGMGRKTKLPYWKIVKLIIYRLKTGCQWRELPVGMAASRILTSWQSVYYHFNKWSKDGSWFNVWTAVLRANKAALDMSSIELDGSHTPAKRGGEAVAYQGRKKAKTTNALFLTDRRGIPLAMSRAVAGNHNDLYQVERRFEEILADVRAADIDTDCLFMNADAGFDSEAFREVCFRHDIFANIDINKRNAKDPDRPYIKDELLYEDRFSVERTNAWIDAFKALLVRFETTRRNWMSLHYLAFVCILLRPVSYTKSTS